MNKGPQSFRYLLNVKFFNHVRESNNQKINVYLKEMHKIGAQEGVKKFLFIYSVLPIPRSRDA